MLLAIPSLRRKVSSSLCRCTLCCCYRLVIVLAVSRGCRPWQRSTSSAGACWCLGPPILVTTAEHVALSRPEGSSAVGLPISLWILQNRIKFHPEPACRTLDMLKFSGKLSYMMSLRHRRNLLSKRTSAVIQVSCILTAEMQQTVHSEGTSTFMLAAELYFLVSSSIFKLSQLENLSCK